MARPAARSAVLAATAAVVAGLLATAARSAPVRQLAPGLVTLATVTTPQGPVGISLHRIRYLGRDRLCLRETHGRTAVQNCTNDPLGSQLHGAVVWWNADADLCAHSPYQVIAGVVIRSGLTATLHTPSHLAPMPTATVPRAFGVRGGLIYALIQATPASVTLVDAAGGTIYHGTVAPIPKLHVICQNGAGFGGVILSGGSNSIP